MNSMIFAAQSRLIIRHRLKTAETARMIQRARAERRRQRGKVAGLFRRSTMGTVPSPVQMKASSQRPVAPSHP